MNDKVEQLGLRLRTKIKRNWAKVTDLDLNEAGKSIGALSVKIQKIYGLSKKTVDLEIAEFRQRLSAERERIAKAALANYKLN